MALRKQQISRPDSFETLFPELIPHLPEKRSLDPTLATTTSSMEGIDDYCKLISSWNRCYSSWEAMGCMRSSMNSFRSPFGSVNHLFSESLDPNERSNQNSGNTATASLSSNSESTYFVGLPSSRILAEVIDFLLFFVLKLVATYFLIYYFQLQIPENEYTLEKFLEKLFIEEAFSFSIDLLMIELAHKCLVIFVESMCIYATGKTPGKALMGIEVINCEQVDIVGGRRVNVYPGGSLTLTQALVRTVIKNTAHSFFFPAAMTVFLFEHRRATYDIISATIVVRSRRPRRRA